MRFRKGSNFELLRKVSKKVRFRKGSRQGLYNGLRSRQPEMNSLYTEIPDSSEPGIIFSFKC